MEALVGFILGASFVLFCNRCDRRAQLEREEYLKNAHPECYCFSGDGQYLCHFCAEKE